MISDTHCHLSSETYRDELDEIIHRAIQAGVTRIITLSTSVENIEETLSLAEHPNVFAAVGIHPCDVHNTPDDFKKLLQPHLHNPKAVAIGETGLDYFHDSPCGWEPDRFHARQRDFLHQHFELAAAHGRNIVIHTRDREGHRSFDDALEIYRQYSSQVRAVFHCFISEWALAEKVLEQGGLISFGGIATFKNAHLVKEVAGKCPKGSFMLETDAPYLSPEPMRGKRNEPAFTAHIAQAIAKLRGESLEELAEHTEAATDLFFPKSL